MGVPLERGKSMHIISILSPGRIGIPSIRRLEGLL